MLDQAHVCASSQQALGRLHEKPARLHCACRARAASRPPTLPSCTACASCATMWARCSSLTRCSAAWGAQVGGWEGGLLIFDEVQCGLGRSGGWVGRRGWQWQRECVYMCVCVCVCCAVCVALCVPGAL